MIGHPQVLARNFPNNESNYALRLGDIPEFGHPCRGLGYLYRSEQFISRRGMGAYHDGKLQEKKVQVP